MIVMMNSYVLRRATLPDREREFIGASSEGYLISEGMRIRKAGIPKVVRTEPSTWSLGYDHERTSRDTHYVMFDAIALQQWRSDIKMLTAAAVPTGHYVLADALKLDERYLNEGLLDTGTALLQSLKQNIERGLITPVKMPNTRVMDVEASVEVIIKLSVRFNEIAKRLRRRHDNRATLDIEDEYDVQDLLHSLLLAPFDDVRSEEWTPSTAGATSRMDLILKTHRIVIETKMMRKGLTDRKLTEELLIDLGLYPAHPDCGYLVIFIFDPDERIGNPAALRDIETRGSVPVKVLVSPRR